MTCNNTQRAHLPAIKYCSAVFFLLLCSLVFAVQPLPVERYALYVAANNGGSERELLRYAISDAHRIATTMKEIGGVRDEHSMILIEPSKDQIDEAFESFALRIKANTGRARRTEFIFYYSGHSDEQAFLLGPDRYEYSALKTALTRVPTDVHVVMLDSCFSGNFVRAKGGTRDKPFLMDDSSVVQGHAYLSSSSATEASLESDRIQASIFTQALVTGLRGAADTSGDGKVSLNELYHYAFNDTLRQTQLSPIGPQHPSYNITLVGSGDLVLTDINDADAVLVFPETTEGRYFIRTVSGLLVSEITKVGGTALALGLPSGNYVVTVLHGNTTRQSTVILAQGERLTLESGSFTNAPRIQGRARGDEPVQQNTVRESAPADDEWIPLSFSLVPGIMYPGTTSSRVRVSISPFMVTNRAVNGIQASGFMGHVSEDLEGIQASGFWASTKDRMEGIQGSGFGVAAFGGFTGIQGSGFMAMAGGHSVGIQGSGFINIADKLDGIQGSGFINIGRTVNGAQIGIVNIAASNTGVAIGLLNFIGDGIMDPGFYIDSEGVIHAQYRGGTRWLYTLWSIGCQINDKIDYGISAFGVGTRVLTSNRLSLDFEILAKHYLDPSQIKALDARIDELEKEQPEGVNKQDLADAYDEYLFALMVPSARVVLNLHLSKNLGVVAMAGFDLNISGRNDKAFTYGNRMENIKIAGGDARLYPVFALGVNF